MAESETCLPKSSCLSLMVTALYKIEGHHCKLSTVLLLGAIFIILDIPAAVIRDITVWIRVSHKVFYTIGFCFWRLDIPYGFVLK